MDISLMTYSPIDGIPTMTDSEVREIQPEDTSVLRPEFDVKKLEKDMLEMEQAEIPLDHIFSAGVYFRQIFIPKGTLLVGKRHRFKTCNIIMTGDLSLSSGDGTPPKRLKGPLIFESPPMTKKIGFAHEDTVFINVYPTELTNLEELEAKYIITEDEYEARLLETSVKKEGDQCPG